MNSAYYSNLQVGQPVAERLGQLVDPPQTEWRLKQTMPVSAFQLNWKTPSWFVQCPDIVSEEGLNEYFRRLAPGAAFTRNRFGERRVLLARLGDNGVLSVISRNPTPVHCAGLVSIRIDGGRYCHEAVAVYFDARGAYRDQSWAIGSHDVFPDEDVG